MVDIVANIITPATTYDLLSLAELKTAMGIAVTDTTNDAQLQQWISRASDTVSVKCNRVFAKEELTERWNCLQSNRVFLGHWPVVASDIQSVETPEGTPIAAYDPINAPGVGGWLLEERSGKLEILSGSNGNGNGWSPSQPLVVHYTGGFDLPDDAPNTPPRPSLYALKQAAELMVYEYRALAMRIQTSGIRSISHKEARVQFYDPTKGVIGGGKAGDAMGAIDSLLMHYVRIQV